MTDFFLLLGKSYRQLFGYGVRQIIPVPSRILMESIIFSFRFTVALGSESETELFGMQKRGQKVPMLLFIISRGAEKLAIFVGNDWFSWRDMRKEIVVSHTPHVFDQDGGQRAYYNRRSSRYCYQATSIRWKLSREEYGGWFQILRKTVRNWAGLPTYVFRVHRNSNIRKFPLLWILCRIWRFW